MYGKMTSDALFAAPADNIGTISSHVLRSYDGNNWERVAGDYASIMSDPSCTATDCTATLPPTISQVNNPYDIFYLITYQHAPRGTQQSKTARFLDKNTFGVTRDAIDNFSRPTNSNRDYALWVQSQMSTRPELHREFFRKNVNKRLSVVE
jgi:hypothetical protein